MDPKKRTALSVIKTQLPPWGEYVGYLEGIWERGCLTNNGPLVKELESKLKDYLGVKHCLLVSSGTIALQLAIKALQLKGEVITTPFSFVATTSALVWEGCKPVYTDIDTCSFCLDPAGIEAAIGPETSAILATHIYGHPCDVDKIQAIAEKYNLKVVYDAAHAFAVKYKKESLLKWGDLSTLSFHATKLFYTGEGGAVVCNDDDLAEKVRRMRDFGIDGPETFFSEAGINGKMSELHAAMGLSVLPYVNADIEKRKCICGQYDEQLKGCPLTKPTVPAATDYNYAYYPVLFPDETSLKKTQQAMRDAMIFPRRYFYPTLNKLSYVNPVTVPVAEDAASRILCLPLYAGLEKDDVTYITSVIKASL